MIYILFAEIQSSCKSFVVQLTIDGLYHALAEQQQPPMAIAVVALITSNCIRLAVQGDVQLCQSEYGDHHINLLHTQV